MCVCVLGREEVDLLNRCQKGAGVEVYFSKEVPAQGSVDEGHVHCTQEMEEYQKICR